MKTNPLHELRRGLSRDQQIVICYKAGNTIIEIAAAFQITKQRVQQILQKDGFSREDNPRTRNQQLYAFIGVNVPMAVKEALAAEARRRHKSISAYLRGLIKEDLSIDIGDESL